MAKCPCCKILNTIAEARKHSSLTAINSALRAWVDFRDGMESAERRLALMLAVCLCPKHGTEESYRTFLADAEDQRQSLISGWRLKKGSE